MEKRILGDRLEVSQIDIVGTRYTEAMEKSTGL